MRVHAFRSPSGTIGLTRQSDGGMLPREEGPWTYWQPVDLDEHVEVVGVDPREARRAIVSTGYHLIRPRVGSLKLVRNA